VHAGVAEAPESQLFPRKDRHSGVQLRDVAGLQPEMRTCERRHNSFGSIAIHVRTTAGGSIAGHSPAIRWRSGPPFASLDPSDLPAGPPRTGSYHRSIEGVISTVKSFGRQRLAPISVTIT
jgi:hypothetical protein